MQVYKAIKYIRLSYTDDKTVESDSVANQRRLIDDYIARHPEIEVVAEKIDDGYSGVLFDRPAFQEMMRMIEQGEANCVIVKDLSRLGREYIETGRYMRRVFQPMECVLSQLTIMWTRKMTLPMISRFLSKTL